MTDAQAAARHQQQLEELCVAAIRALSLQRDLHFRGRRLHQGRRRLPLWAPHLHPSLEHDDFASFRGAADGLALRLRFSNEPLQQSLLAPEPLRQMLMQMLEQFRVESLAGEQWGGVRRNLRHRFERWALGFHDQGLTESVRGLLLFTVALVAHARITGQPVPEALEDPIEGTRATWVPRIGSLLDALRRSRHDQAAFGRHARALADAVAGDLEAIGAGLDADDRSRRPEKDERTAFGVLMPLDDAEEGDAIGTVALGRSRTIEASAEGYRVYTTAYDRELRPAAQMRREQLDEFRSRLDARVAAMGVNPARLARELRQLLSRPGRDDWASAQEEGLIDGRRLSQLVVSPTERRLFRHERQEPVPDTALTVLIDCSGSMRQHIEGIAALVDLLARALDLAGIANEVLGFSTGAWSGGRAARDWQRAGRPAHPGRLAEVSHLVFKDAATPWRHARRDMAALLRPDLFREGVDGEALQWAARRLRSREEPRKWLIVVSDGCPMETATLQANDDHYLDHHLQQVAGAIETEGDIELAALGVGLDLSPYYGHCQAIELDAHLGRRIVQDLLTLLSRRSRR